MLTFRLLEAECACLCCYRNKEVAPCGTCRVKETQYAVVTINHFGETGGLEGSLIVRDGIFDFFFQTSARLILSKQHSCFDGS